MVFLGFGKYVRSDRIYAVEPIVDERGSGARTRVWVEGIADPIVASRTERAILAERGVLPRRARPGARDPGGDGVPAGPRASGAAGRKPLLEDRLGDRPA